MDTGKKLWIITVYKRHTASCDHRADRTWKRCNCKVWLQWSKDGKQVQRSAKTRSWEDAVAQARAIEQQSTSLAASPVTAKTVAQAIEEFLNDRRTVITKRGRQIADDSVYRHELTLSSLQDYCNQQGIWFLKDIDLGQLRKWKTTWTVKKAHARNSYQAKVRCFFSFCHSNGMIAENPAKKLDKIHVNAGENIRALEPKELERVIAAISRTTMTDANKARIKALIELQRWSGLSLVDAVRLSKDELKQANGQFRVSCERKKTGTHINNLIPAWLGEELLKVKNGNPEYFFWAGPTPEDAPNATSYFHKLYKQVSKAAGIKWSSHDLRHTAAIELLKKRVDIRTVSKFLGHKNVQITERHYAPWNWEQQEIMDDTLREAMNR